MQRWRDFRETKLYDFLAALPMIVFYMLSIANMVPELLRELMNRATIEIDVAFVISIISRIAAIAFIALALFVLLVRMGLERDLDVGARTKELPERREATLPRLVVLPGVLERLRIDRKFLKSQRAPVAHQKILVPEVELQPFLHPCHSSHLLNCKEV